MINAALQKVSPQRRLFLISLVFTILTIIAGLIITGGPFKQREFRMDEKRTKIITELGREINSYYRLNSKLPSDLKFLKYSQKFKDPKTGKLPEYQVKNKELFLVCTSFSTSSLDENRTYSRLNYWDFTHPKGYFCINYKKTNNDKYGENFTAVNAKDFQNRYKPYD